MSNPVPPLDNVPIVQRGIRAGAGSDWIESGWQLFRAAPLRWSLSLAVVMLPSLALSRIPMVGMHLATLLGVLGTAVSMQLVDAAVKGEPSGARGIVAAFKRLRFDHLLVLGIVNTLVTEALSVVMSLPGPSPVTGEAAESGLAPGESFGVLRGLAVACLVSFPAAMAFCVQLIQLDRCNVLRAIPLSAMAFFPNWAPLLVWLLQSLLILLPLLIPIAAGFFVNSPAIMMLGFALVFCWAIVMAMSSYFAWRDLFGAAPTG